MQILLAKGQKKNPEEKKKRNKNRKNRIEDTCVKKCFHPLTACISSYVYMLAYTCIFIKIKTTQNLKCSFHGSQSNAALQILKFPQCSSVQSRKITDAANFFFYSCARGLNFCENRRWQPGPATKQALSVFNATTNMLK